MAVPKNDKRRLEKLAGIATTEGEGINMSQYRIVAAGRQYYCDAEDKTKALRHFHDNVDGVEVESLTSLTEFKKSRTASETKPAPRRQSRRVSR